MGMEEISAKVTVLPSVQSRPCFLNIFVLRRMRQKFLEL